MIGNLSRFSITFLCQISSTYQYIVPSDFQLVQQHIDFPMEISVTKFHAPEFVQIYFETLKTRL